MEFTRFIKRFVETGSIRRHGRPSKITSEMFRDVIRLRRSSYVPLQLYGNLFFIATVSSRKDQCVFSRCHRIRLN